MDSKLNYGQFVELSRSEYQELINKFGQDITDRCIEKLDWYIGAYGKTNKYKSHYYAILSWVEKSVRKEMDGDPGEIERVWTKINEIVKWINKFREAVINDYTGLCTRIRKLEETTQILEIALSNSEDRVEKLERREWKSKDDIRIINSQALVLKTLRKKYGLTQIELAEKAKIYQPLISDAELGKRQLYPAAIERIALALGIPAEELRDKIDMACSDREKPGIN